MNTRAPSPVSIQGQSRVGPLLLYVVHGFLSIYLHNYKRIVGVKKRSRSRNVKKIKKKNGLHRYGG